MENLMDCLKAMQSKDLKMLDSIVIASDSKGKKRVKMRGMHLLSAAFQNMT